MSNYRVADIPVESISFGERFRQDYDLDELRESIEEKGILQPITVTEHGDGYLLVAGGRRLRVAQELELANIPALVREIEDELDFREIELLENVQRKNLTWQEQINIVKRLDSLMREKYGVAKNNKTKGWSIRKTAQMLDKAAGGVHRQLDLADWMEKLPLLQEAKTEDEAVRMLRKIREGIETKQLIKSRDARVSAEENGERTPDDDLKSQYNIPVVRLASYADKHYRVGDAFEGLEELIALHREQKTKANIGFIEVDPPYGIDLAAKKSGGKTKALEAYEEVDAGEYPTWLRRLCELLYEAAPDRCRVLFWFGQEWQGTVYQELMSAGFTVDPIPAVWYKKAGQTNNPEMYLARTYETFFIAWKGKAPLLRKRGRSNVFEFTPVAGQKKWHPTQRPVELMQELLQTFAWPGQIVMSPFLGSGVTLQACYRESMQPFGWDLNPANKEPFLAAIERDITEYLRPMCREAQLGDSEEE